MERKVGLLFINPYFGTDMELGEAVINDGILFEEELRKRGYSVYKFIDTTASTFAEKVITYSTMDLDSLLIYYSGHGMSVRDRNGDESDRKDEAFVFRDGYLLDDISNKLIAGNRAKHLFLISDCCHSGTIWDNVNPESTCVISACQDDQTAKQTAFPIHFNSKKSMKTNGVLTYYLWKYMPRCSDDLFETIRQINPLLKKYNQKATITGEFHKL